MTSDLRDALTRTKPLVAGLTLAAVLAALVTGCATPRRQAQKLDPARVQQFEANGYPPPHQYAVTQTDELRVVQGRPMHLVWTRPQQAGPHPLVVYLPGAGQDARAFAPWRKALAEAGYVVLSWQALPEDEQRPQGDTRAWAMQRFADEPLKQRGAMLAALMADLSRGRAAGEPGLQDVNVAQAALAGYELGAYAAQWVAGEHMTHVPDAPAMLTSTFKAFIWLSPFASFSQGAFETRYADLKAPSLTITSEKDTDPLGLVSAAYLRSAPFGGMPVGHKFMLMFRGMGHDDLGGREGAERLRGAGPGEAGEHGGPAGEGGPGKGASGDEDGPGGGMPSGGGGMGGGMGGGPGGMGGGGMGGGRGPGGDGHGGMGRGEGGDRVSPTQQAMQRSALTTMSIAFLDACLLDDPLARQWLSDQAGRWLKPVADLHGK